MVNHPSRNPTNPQDERMRALGIPCNSVTRVLWLRAHMMGLTFAGRLYPGTAGGAHYSFAIFKGTEDRAFDDADAMGTAVHQDALRAWLDGFQAAASPDHTLEIIHCRRLLKRAGYAVRYVDQIKAPEQAFEVDHATRLVKIAIGTIGSVFHLSMAIAEALVQVNRDADEFPGLLASTGS